MKLLTKSILAAFEKQNNISEKDRKPIIKLFTPDANMTWILSEFDPETEIFFGLCDLGLGFTELGYVSLSEITKIRGFLNLPVERDLHTTFNKTILEYAEQAIKDGYIRA